MRAIGVDGDRLVWQEQPDLRPRKGEVRIRVAATAVNRADLAQRAGTYPPPPGASEVLGLECAGTVDAVGPGVTRWREGHRVCALLAGGGYAEQVVAQAGQLLPVPDGMSFTDAAALPEVLTTAWLNLFGEAGLRPGEMVLLHAGASGVGTAAIQLCRAFGNRCAVTAGSRDKIDRCVALGAEVGWNRHDGPWLEAARQWTHGRGIDVILDPVGAAYLADDLAALAVGGRLVVIGLLGGRSAPLDLGRLMVRRLRVIGSVLRSRSIAEKAEILDGLERAVWPLVASGAITPIVDRILPIAAADEAHRVVASNDTVGKVVMTVG